MAYSKPSNSRTTNTAPKACFFCVNQINNIEPKDTHTLNRFLSSYAKILPRRKTGVCSLHQRKLSNAIKRARIMALLPFIKR